MLKLFETMVVEAEDGRQYTVSQEVVELPADEDTFNSKTLDTQERCV